MRDGHCRCAYAQHMILPAACRYQRSNADCHIFSCVHSLVIKCVATPSVMRHSSFFSECAIVNILHGWVPRIKFFAQITWCIQIFVQHRPNCSRLICHKCRIADEKNEISQIRSFCLWPSAVRPKEYLAQLATLWSMQIYWLYLFCSQITSQENWCNWLQISMTFCFLLANGTYHFSSI